MSKELPKPESTPLISPDDIERTVTGLRQLNWGEQGLTRHEIKAQDPHFPDDVFLRMPESKRFSSAAEVLHAAGLAESRAEGEFLGSDPDLPEADSLANGGPPAWGGDPIFSVGGVEESGSREDTEGLESGS